MSYGINAMFKQVFRGFSLIELLVVIAIIGTLSAIAIPGYKTYSTKAKIDSLLPKMDSLKATASQYYEKHGSWPTTIQDLGFSTSNDLDTTLVTSFNVCATGCAGTTAVHDYSGDFGIFLRLDPTQLNLPATSTTPTLVFNANVNSGISSWYCTTVSATSSVAQNIPAAFLPTGCVSPD